MKKIIACMSLVFALSAGATALAAVGDVNNAYIKDGNKLDVDIAGATSMHTVLITKDDVSGNEGIVFADQNDDTFSSVASFLLKGDKLAEGTYTVKMNTKDGGPATEKTFTISDEPPKEIGISTAAFTYTKKDSKGNDIYDTGFTVNNEDLSNIKYIAVTNPDNQKTVYFDFPNIKGTANVAIRINNIPEGKSVSVKLVDAQSSSGNE